MRGLGIDQLHRHPLTTFFVGGKHADIAQCKIAVARAAGAVAGHRLVRECLDPNGVQAHRLQFGREHPPIIGGIFAAHEKGAVGLFGKGRTIERLGLQMIEDHPVLLLQRALRRIPRPQRKAPGQLVFFKLGQGSCERRMRLFPFGSDLRKITVHRQINLAADGRGEGVDETIVIAHGNGIELVIVTTRAADRQPQHRCARGVSHIIELIVTGGFEFLLGQLRGKHARAEEARSLHGQRIVRRQLVPSDLPFHKLIIRHIGIKRLNDEVAVMKRKVTVVILLKPMALRKTRHIQPVPPPSLAVMLGGKQTVDNLCVSLLRRIGHKRRDFSRRRRQADQIKIQPTNLRARIRQPVGLQLGRLQFTQHKPINVVGWPVLLLHHRRLDGLQRGEGPKIPVIICHLHALAGNRLLYQWLIVRRA